MGLSSKESGIAERVALMCASALFAGLTPQECTEIASCSSARNFVRDQMLFMQGQPVRNLVLIEAGAVKLTQLSPSGNEVILWMNKAGETLGVPHEAPACNHTCSARAMEQCKAVTWEFSRLQSLLTEYPQIRRNIIRIQTDRLRELEERFREVASEKVAQRVALALLRLVGQVGRSVPEGSEVGLSREELAQITGTTLFTISRLLSRWAEDGFVLPRREAVIVRDPRGLRLVGCEE